MKFLTAALLAAVAMPAMAATNLVTNGSFESGLSGWSTSGDAGFITVEGAGLGFTPTAGLLQAAFGAAGSAGTLSQTVATTPGNFYLISFDVAASPAGQQFRVDFGSFILLNNRFRLGQTYTTLWYELIANSSSAVLSFQAARGPGSYALDNVSVIRFNLPTDTVPEPQTWALLVAGFGLVGSSLRRRRQAQA